MNAMPRGARLHALSTMSSQQRGAAALVVTVLLCFAMALAVATVHRHLVVDQRTAAHQVRSTQAFEAAEAGIEWMLAALNDNRRVDDDCVPTASPAAASLRDRLLDRAEVDAPFLPITWLDHGVATPLQASCTESGGGWTCHCPSASAPDPAASPGAGPSFAVRLLAGDAPGVVKVVATGCSRSGTACDTSDHESTARIATSFALLRAVANQPPAPVVARGDVIGNDVAWLARNDDPSSGGLALLAGGDVQALLASLQGPAASSAADSSVAHDSSLAGRTPARFFAAFFGVDEAHWSARAGVQHVACIADCSVALTRAVEAGGRNAVIVVDGELRIDTSTTLGRDDRPVLIVVRGAARLNAPVTLHGLLAGASVTTSAGAAGSLFHGAVLSSGDIHVDTVARFVADASLLARLRAGTGTFARVSGAWRDF